VLENGAPSAPDTRSAADTAAEVNALATVQVELAADPSDYSVTGDQITVQALETLGHYADWLGVPTQRLRELNRMAPNQAVVLGQRLTLDFSKVDPAAFERRRVAYQQQRQGEFFARYQIEDIEDHVIKPGESLWVLAARRYKVPVWLLRQYNPDLDFDRIRPGTIVKFPRLRSIAPPGTSVPEAVANRSD
jgi:membrane-bound lytic murein transglycosylase D